MRFKKGDKIEVLNKREDPTGSWWCGEIISGNGHNYYIRYDRGLAGIDSTVERVPRKAIRPYPPSVKSRLDWVPGDIVEVLHNFSWKLAKIVMFSGGEQFFVRLLGSSTKFNVQSSGIRLRQCWQDNKWFTFGKDLAKRGGRTTNVLSKEKFISKAIGDQLQAKKNTSFEDTSQILTMSVNKRARECPYGLERCTEAFKKMRTFEKEGVLGSNSAWEQVDAVAAPQTILGEKYMHSSIINRKTRIFETNQGIEEANAGGRRHSRVMLEGSDAESVSSSVGSCSVNEVLGGNYMESHHDFSEASVTLGREIPLPTNEGLGEHIHSLELHAYRRTMLALYASGPFSWEQEALLTNLRSMLHISNDEHLTELKTLISS